MTVIIVDSEQVTDLGGTVIERAIEGVGVLRFEDFKAGQWLTQKGEPAKIAKRRYLLDGAELDSMSSIVGTLDKPALLRWYENGGIVGGVKAQRLGELDDVPQEDWPDRVRLLNLGAEAARDEAADRGTVIHGVFDTLAHGGDFPNVGDYPPEWRGWMQGTARAWMALNPQPRSIEQIICNAGHRYAGRPDLIALVNDQLTLLDYKTGKGKVYDGAHYQTRGYAECLPACGLDPVERIVIVGIDDDGGFQLVECEASADDFYGLLGVFRSRKSVNAGMAAQRKALKAATKAAA